MDALRAYDSDFSESNEPGDEQAGGAAAEDAADFESLAEQRLFQLGGSEVGVLSFLASCPPYTKIKIQRKFFVAADLEEVFWEGGGTDYHFITRSLSACGARVDAHSKGSIDAGAICWEEPTFTYDAHVRFSHAGLADMLALMFDGAAFICQEHPGVWVVWNAADFMDLAEPNICCLSRVQDEAENYISLSESIDAALAVKLCMSDEADFQRDLPQVAECDADAGSVRVHAFRTGQGKLEGYFEGNGEQLGTWDTYTAFWSEPSSKLSSVRAGRHVSTPGAKDGAVLVRILRGTKKGGAHGNQQACYVCLLYKLNCTSGSCWMYATMPNIGTLSDTKVNTPTMIGDDVSKEMMSMIQEELRSFTPASVSGAVQKAANAIPAESKVPRKRKQS